MFDNPFSMVVAIVFIVSVAGVLRAKYSRDHKYDDDEGRPNADAIRAQDEIRALKDRIAVLERIATENNRGMSLDREIEALRQRD